MLKHLAVVKKQMMVQFARMFSQIMKIVLRILFRQNVLLILNARLAVASTTKKDFAQQCLREQNARKTEESGKMKKIVIYWNAKRTAVFSEMKPSLSQKKDVNCFHLFLDLKKISEILEQNMNASHLKQIKLKGRVFLKMEFASLEQKVNAFVLEENFQKEICVQKKV